MQIKMRTLAAGSAGVFKPGSIYSVPLDLTEEMAQAFVDGGYAENVTPDPILLPDDELQTPRRGRRAKAAVTQQPTEPLQERKGTLGTLAGG